MHKFYNNISINPIVTHSKSPSQIIPQIPQIYNKKSNLFQLRSPGKQKQLLKQLFFQRCLREYSKINLPEKLEIQTLVDTAFNEARITENFILNLEQHINKRYQQNTQQISNSQTSQLSQILPNPESLPIIQKPKQNHLYTKIFIPDYADLQNKEDKNLCKPLLNTSNINVYQFNNESQNQISPYQSVQFITEKQQPNPHSETKKNTQNNPSIKSSLLPCQINITMPLSITPQIPQINKVNSIFNIRQIFHTPKQNLPISTNIIGEDGKEATKTQINNLDQSSDKLYFMNRNNYVNETMIKECNNNKNKFIKHQQNNSLIDMNEQIYSCELKQSQICASSDLNNYIIGKNNLNINIDFDQNQILDDLKYKQEFNLDTRRSLNSSNFLLELISPVKNMFSQISQEEEIQIKQIKDLANICVEKAEKRNKIQQTKSIEMRKMVQKDWEEALENQQQREVQIIEENQEYRKLLEKENDNMVKLMEQKNELQKNRKRAHSELLFKQVLYKQKIKKIEKEEEMNVYMINVKKMLNKFERENQDQIQQEFNKKKKINALFEQQVEMAKRNQYKNKILGREEEVQILREKIYLEQMMDLRTSQTNELKCKKIITKSLQLD